jgi:hypothetical protein
MHDNTALCIQASDVDLCEVDNVTDLPGNSQFLIDIFRPKEPVNVFLQHVLEFILQDNVLPIRLLNLCP